MSRGYPQIFFKPLFACAAANKDVTVVRQLSILNALTKFLPDFWTRDSDMMSVALMSDVAGSQPVPDRTSLSIQTPRIGQLILAVELAEQLRIVRHTKDLSTVSGNCHSLCDSR